MWTGIYYACFIVWILFIVMRGLVSAVLVACISRIFGGMKQLSCSDPDGEFHRRFGDVVQKRPRSAPGPTGAVHDCSLCVCMYLLYIC